MSSKTRMVMDVNEFRLAVCNLNSAVDTSGFCLSSEFWLKDLVDRCYDLRITLRHLLADSEELLEKLEIELRNQRRV